MVKKKGVTDKPFGYGEVIEDLDFTEEIKEAFDVVAAKMNFDRAFPAVEDGLKPVWRRAVFGLDTEGIRPGKLTKAAKAVAIVMGDYHPHGDASIYGTIVNMQQQFKTRVPLIHGHGGWGTISIPEASAMRYPECHLTEAATVLDGLHVWSDSKLSEVREGYLPMMKNYTGEKDEPIRLPALFPNLVINGYTGTGMGIAGKLPPHDPTQTLDLALHLIDTPNIRTATALSKLPGPDLPTKCQVFDDDGGIESYMTTGKGSYIMRATYRVEGEGKKKFLVFTSLPFGVSPESVINGISKKVDDGTLPVHVNAVNHSTKDVEIRVSCGATDPEELAQALFSYGGSTKLQIREVVNNYVYVDDTRLEVLGVIDCLKHWLDHRRKCILERSVFRMSNVERRIEIVEGYIKMVPLAQDVVRLVQESESRKTAADAMVTKWGFTQMQADAILSMTLSQLTRSTGKDYQSELDKLTLDLEFLDSVINDHVVLQSVLRDEVRAVRKFLKGERMSELMEGSADVKKPKLNVADSSIKGYLAVTNDNWVRWVSRDDIKRDISGDYVDTIYKTDTSVPVLAVTTQGRGCVLDMVSMAKEKKTGYTNLKMLLAKKLNPGEDIVSITPLAGDSDLVVTTVHGGIKRLARNGFATQKVGRVFDVLKLKSDDSVVSANAVTGDGPVYLTVTESGRMTLVPADQVNAKAGRAASTMPLMKLDAGDKVIKTIVLDSTEDKSLIYATTSDHVARVFLPNMDTHNRNVKGTGLLRPSELISGIVVAAPGDTVVYGDDEFSELALSDIPIGTTMTPRGMVKAADVKSRLMVPQTV